MLGFFLVVSHSEYYCTHTVRIGSIDFNTGGQVRQVESGVAHPDWMRNTEGTDANDGEGVDLAVVKLTSFVDDGTTFQVLNKDGNAPAIGSNVVVIGMGETDATMDVTKLQQVTLQVEDGDNCMFDNDEKQEQFCAYGGGNGMDSCRGDSGGPIYIQDTKNGGFVQVGISAADTGGACGGVDVRAILTRISFFEDWIEDRICELSAGKSLVGNKEMIRVWLRNPKLYLLKSCYMCSNLLHFVLLLFAEQSMYP